jgi:hypothetical protein
MLWIRIKWPACLAEFVSFIISVELYGAVFGIAKNKKVDALEKFEKNWPQKWYISMPNHWRVLLHKVYVGYYVVGRVL